MAITLKNMHDNSSTAFGESMVAELTPQIQLNFAYGVNSRMVKTQLTGSGSVTTANGKAQVNTTAAASSSARIQSLDRIQYTTGQGVRIRFTAIFTKGASGSEQWIGIGNEEDGFFIGYRGTDFGILRRSGGKYEIRTATVTGAATGSNNLVVTLDGVATNVALLNGDNVVTVASKIAAATFAGWDAYAVGATVIFKAYTAAARSGTFSTTEGGTGATTTWAQTVAGNAPTENVFYRQDVWNGEDNMLDEKGPAQNRLDPTKLNVYQISFQWLGAGQIDFYTENIKTGGLHIISSIQYNGTALVPSIRNPTLPLWASVENTSNTSAVTLSTPSFAGFTEGKYIPSGTTTSFNNTLAASATTQTPVLTVRNAISYNGVSNRISCTLESILVGASLASGAARVSTIRIYSNPTLVGGSTAFADYDTTNSVLSSDIAATGTSGGRLLYSFPMLPSVQPIYIDFPIEQTNIHLQPGDRLTVTAQTASGGTNDVTASLNFFERL